MNKKKNFHEQLVLNRFVFKIFKQQNLSEIKNILDHSYLQGVNETDGQSLYFHALINNLIDERYISIEQFSRYDINIIKHWNQITHLRNKSENTTLHMKYFQYLSLLFTEVYLDYYFNNQEIFIKNLNQEMYSFNKEKSEKDLFSLYNPSDLRKIAFWNATGSGKTLLMHINILQYLDYYKSKNLKNFPDKIILLTPNEGLSVQHVNELIQSKFEARLFDKNTNVFPGTVEVIDINKLGDKMGEKVVAIDAFEGDNLVLIDEGHRGAAKADGAWMSRREALTSNGFSFEYSATFGQIASKALTLKEAEEDYKKKKAKLLLGRKTVYSRLSEEQKLRITINQEEKNQLKLLALRETYGKCILFDYSYKFFYEDGYGKESRILNLQNESEEENRYSYLVGAILSFYQQNFLWEKNPVVSKKYSIEKPLMVFVGNKVNDEDSDILDVIKFIDRFLQESDGNIYIINSLINNQPIILDGNGNNPFHNAFLALSNEDGEKVYNSIIEKVFNASSNHSLRMKRLKNAKGEIALQLGNFSPFAVINIGDEVKLSKTIEKNTRFSLEVEEFKESLFDSINSQNSAINILIGSKKFTEGWSSWRVSTMGLLNMGKSEGAQIIQLFGRGVRLKGEAYSLKRSVPAERPKGAFLEKLETLNIFGIKANYIAQFREYLREEDILVSEDFIEVTIPAVKREKINQLKVITLKNDYLSEGAKNFKNNKSFSLFNIPEDLSETTTISKVVVDLYPRVASLFSNSSHKIQMDSKEEFKIPMKLIMAMNFDRIYLELLERKNMHKINNMRIVQSELNDFLTREKEWYTLYAPKSLIEIQTYKDFIKIENIFIQMLEDYMIKFYKAIKNAYESSNYEITTLDENRGLWIQNYTLSIENSEESSLLVEKIEELKRLVDTKSDEKSLKEWSSVFIGNIFSSSHLYQPLLYKKSDAQPISINLTPKFFGAPSEIQFVKDFESYIQNSKKLINKQIYLLRNADSKQKGFGFAQAGNFYPDFLLWILDDKSGEQWLTFIDPKGIRNMNLNSAKFELPNELKKIQKSIGVSNLNLNAFILSITHFNDLINIQKNTTQEDLEQKNVIFMNDEKYIRKMIDRINLFE